MTLELLQLTPTEYRKFSEIHSIEQMVDRLRGNQSKEFERYVGFLYQEDGYRVFTTGAAADGGIDLVADRDDRRTAIQCKRFDPRGQGVGRPVLQQLDSAMADVSADDAAVVTTARFSNTCFEWNQTRGFDLIDGESLEQRARILNPPPTTVRRISPVAGIGRNSSRFRLPNLQRMGLGIFGRNSFSPRNLALGLLLALLGCWVSYFFFSATMGLYRALNPQEAVVAENPSNLSLTPYHVTTLIPESMLLATTTLIPEVIPPTSTPYPVATAISTNAPTPLPAAPATTEPYPAPAEPTVQPTPTLIPTAQPTPQPTPTPIDPGRVAAKQLSSAPTIDGDLTDWAHTAIYRSGQQLHCEENIDATQDADVLWQIGWDNEFLYIAAQVEDDVYYAVNAVGQGHLGDSVELWIGPANREGIGAGFSAQDSVITLVPQHSNQVLQYGRHSAETSQSSSMQNMSAHAIIFNKDDNLPRNYRYAIESKIPWSAIGLTPADQPFALALTATDNDAHFARSEIVYGNVAGSVVENPTTWGTLTLENE